MRSLSSDNGKLRADFATLPPDGVAIDVDCEAARVTPHRNVVVVRSVLVEQPRKLHRSGWALGLRSRKLRYVELLRAARIFGDSLSL